MADFITVLVRTRDRIHLLPAALKSIAEQEYKNIKTVIINDGSSDIPDSFFSDILGEIDFLYVKNESPLGRGAALNKGISYIDTPFFSILDDDDIYYPNGLKALIMTNNSLGLPVYGRVIAKKMLDSGQGEIHDILGTAFDFGKLLFENFIPTNSILIPTAAAKSIAPFREDLEIYEDWEWLIRLTEKFTPKFIDTFIAEYRIYGDNTLTGKGGEDYHRFYREQVLAAHIDKFTPSKVLNYISLIKNIGWESREKENYRILKLLEDKDGELVKLERDFGDLKRDFSDLKREFGLREDEFLKLQKLYQDKETELQKISSAHDTIYSALSTEFIQLQKLYERKESELVDLLNSISKKRNNKISVNEDKCSEDDSVMKKLINLFDGRKK